MTFEIELPPCDMCDRTHITYRDNTFYCQVHLDAEYGAWRTYACGQCGRETDALLNATVYCYNTVYHNRKGGIKMEVKK